MQMIISYSLHVTDYIMACNIIIVVEKLQDEICRGCRFIKS